MVCPVKKEGDILCLSRCLLDLIFSSEEVLPPMAFPSVVIFLAIPSDLGASACVGEAPRTTRSVVEGSVAEEGCIPPIIHVFRQVNVCLYPLGACLKGLPSHRSRRTPGNFEGGQADCRIGGLAPVHAATEVTVYSEDSLADGRVVYRRNRSTGGVPDGSESDLDT